ncbi:hypothetical protein FND50_33715 [Rhodococcus sp. WB9]|uniref:hypothetical protein n=1 Tax=Rhodococcus sp. WB9 TaxID=2594007 RepID=UPI00118706EA|nr:hypothetical protein [Rhodococcus sp. WB9]QDQ95228.1 hypothetical protein FND50_33715 [Rhodococcus sp. WB9]
MKMVNEPYFGSKSRRVVLERGLDDAPVPQETANRDGLAVTLDVSLTIGTRRARLIAWRDDDDDYVALAVGDVSGAQNVPVRAVEEELLLIEGSRSGLPAEILVAVPHVTAGLAIGGRGVVDCQVRVGGPIRDMLTMTEVASVVVAWCDTSAPAA